MVELSKIRNTFHLVELHRYAGVFSFILELTDIHYSEIFDAVIQSECENLNNAWVECKCENKRTILSGSALVSKDFVISNVKILIIFEETTAYLDFPAPTLVEQGPVSFSQMNNSWVVTHWSKHGLTETDQKGSKISSSSSKYFEQSQVYFHRDVFESWNDHFLRFLPRSHISSNVGRLDYPVIEDENTSRIRKLKNVHKGKDAILIGNGPSLDVSKLDAFAGLITFGFNRFYLGYSEFTLRPDYLISADDQMIDDFGHEMVRQLDSTVILADSKRPEFDEDFIWLNKTNIFPALFSEEIDRFVTPGGATPYVAMQIAAYMGIKNIYLIGFDYHYNMIRNHVSPAKGLVSGDNNHFVKGYRSGIPWVPPSFRNIAHSFWIARMYFESKGGRIINLSPNSALQMFDLT